MNNVNIQYVPPDQRAMAEDTVNAHAHMHPHTHTNLQSLPQVDDGCFDSVLLYLHCSHYLVLLCNLRGLELLTRSTYSLLALAVFAGWRGEERMTHLILAFNIGIRPNPTISTTVLMIPQQIKLMGTVIIY